MVDTFPIRGGDKCHPGQCRRGGHAQGRGAFAERERGTIRRGARRYSTGVARVARGWWRGAPTAAVHARPGGFP
eukprot:2841112-Prymnesium_polylepis.1